MRKSQSVITAASSLPTVCAERGIVPPFQLVSPTSVVHAWLVVARDGDAVYADEWGELLWARPTGARTARVVRPLWPEEKRTLADAIARGVETITGV